MKTRLLLLALLLVAQSALANKIAVVSTQFVLERKFKLMEETARKQGVDLAWTQVDREGEAGLRRVLKDASLIIVDAPRSDDQVRSSASAARPCAKRICRRLASR